MPLWLQVGRRLQLQPGRNFRLVGDEQLPHLAPLDPQGDTQARDTEAELGEVWLGGPRGGHGGVGAGAARS